MNKAHLDLLVSEDWRTVLRDYVLPFAFDGLTPSDLGSDVVEIGPGPGLTTDLLRSEFEKLTAVEIDPLLASSLEMRLAGSNVDVVEADGTAMPFEAGRFTGAMAFTMFHHVPTEDLQDRLFAEIFRVLMPGGLFVTSDSVASDDLLALHVDDVYNPIDPTTLESRLRRIGFDPVAVVDNGFAWRCHATRP